MGFMQQLRANLKLNDSVKRPRVRLKSFPCTFWNSSGVFQDMLLEINVRVTTTTIYSRELTQVADKYRSHYDKTTENCGFLFLQYDAHKDNKIQTKKFVFCFEF